MHYFINLCIHQFMSLLGICTFRSKLLLDRSNMPHACGRVTVIFFPFSVEPLLRAFRLMMELPLEFSTLVESSKSIKIR